MLGMQHGWRRSKSTMHTVQQQPTWRIRFWMTQLNNFSLSRQLGCLIESHRASHHPCPEPRQGRSLNAFHWPRITVLLRSVSAISAGSCLRSISMVTNGSRAPSIKLHYWMGVGFWVVPHELLALLGIPFWKLMSSNKNSFCRAPCLQDLIRLH